MDKNIIVYLLLIIGSLDGVSQENDLKSLLKINADVGIAFVKARSQSVSYRTIEDFKESDYYGEFPFQGKLRESQILTTGEVEIQNAWEALFYMINMLSYWNDFYHGKQTEGPFRITADNVGSNDNVGYYPLDIALGIDALINQIGETGYPLNLLEKLKKSNNDLLAFFKQFPNVKKALEEMNSQNSEWQQLPGSWKKKLLTSNGIASELTPNQIEYLCLYCAQEFGDEWGHSTFNSQRIEGLRGLFDAADVLFQEINLDNIDHKTAAITSLQLDHRSYYNDDIVSFIKDNHIKRLQYTPDSFIGFLTNLRSIDELILDCSLITEKFTDQYSFFDSFEEFNVNSRVILRNLRVDFPKKYSKKLSYTLVIE